MTTFPLRPLLVAIILGLAAGQAEAESTSPTIENLGNNTYRVSASATHKFTRNTAKLTEEATAAASAFCAKLGKQLKIVSMEENKSFYGVGEMARATLTFKALDLADPELASSATPVGGAAQVASASPLTNEALYADLLRLDDLHKKGILTDEEFAAEKKKVLDRSK